MPVWARIPVVIILVLSGVFAGAVVAGAAGIGGGHGPDKHPPVQRPGDDGGRHVPPAGGHR